MRPPTQKGKQASQEYASTNETIIDHSTMQRKLRPFLGVWQATRKDDAAECKSTLDLLPEDLSLSCFGEGKLTQRSKRQGYQYFFLCDAVFLVSFLPCWTLPPDHVHESLPDHFRPCPQNTWAPHYTVARDCLKPKGVSALTDRSLLLKGQDLTRHWLKKKKKKVHCHGGS